MSPKGIPYVTGKLHRIGGQLAEANSRRGGTAENPQAPEEGAPQDAVQTPSPEATHTHARKSQPRSQEAEKALRHRHDEYTRLKRDVATRLSEQLASLPQEASALKARAEAALAAEAKLRGLFESMEALPEPSMEDEEYQRKLAESFKTVENTRLEMIMTLSKLEVTPSPRQHAQRPSRGGAESILPELNSLTFKQLFTFGLYLTLPVAGAIVLGGLIIAIAILAAMRLGI